MTHFFRYQNKRYPDGLVLFDAQDIGAEDYEAILDFLAGKGTLAPMPMRYVHPFGYYESEAETRAREEFVPEDWRVLAAFRSSYSETGFDTALILHVPEPMQVAVVELKDGMVLHSVFGDCEIALGDEPEKPMIELLEDFEGTPIARPKNEPSPIVAPAFSPTSKGKIKKIVLAPTPSKPSVPTTYHPEFVAPEPEEEEDEETPIQVSYEAPSFQANSSKKPRNLGNRFTDKKPSNPAKPAEKPSETPSVSPSFTPSSNKRPANLTERKQTYIERQTLGYRHDYSFLYGAVVPLDQRDAKSLALLGKVAEDLRAIHGLKIIPNCCFSPNLPPEKFPEKTRLRNFDVDAWHVLAADTNRYGAWVSCLISFKEQTDFCAIVSKEGEVLAIGFRGISLSHLKIPFDALLRRLQKPTPTAKPAEEKAKEPEEKKTPEPIEPPTPKRLVAHRRVFVANSFKKDRERFVRKYHAQAERDFDETIIGLLSCDDDSLNAFLSANDSKPIESRNGVTIYKFRFGNSAEYEAARLFYCRGYDVKRKMDASDFLLLGVSDQGEHEEQGEIARLFSRMFASDDIVLHQQFLPQDKTGSIDELAYMSKRQFSLLEKAKEEFPAAFIGSAGTGKTLMSLRHYLSLKDHGARVLYLTYQRTLCDEIKKKLVDLGATGVETMTYRELCGSVFPDGSASKMQTKRGFRDWFKDFVSRNGSLRKRLRQVGPTLEDQFMICYVFYRGVIDGSRKNLASRKGKILSLDEFFEAMRNEEGFSPEAKKTVYEVALAYEKTLVDGKTTDNKLAQRIIALGPRAKRYDAVVIDEFQDLSEVQFMAAVSLLKPADPLPLFIYGDENQAINPTIFGLSEASSILREMLGKRQAFHVQELNDSFRSGPNLVHYINDINATKRRAIGARGQGDAPEVSLREDEEDLFATLVEGKENLPRLLEICAKSDKEVVFIFPSVSHAEAMAKAYGHIDRVFVDSSFLSVEEAKGREWDSAVLVDFFSSSAELFDAMLGETRVGKHSTVHRMLFNRFYVALTRAKNRIVVYERSPSPMIREKLLSGLTALPDLHSLEDYFAGQVDETAWRSFGDKLMADRKYPDAYKAYNRAEGEEAAKLAALARSYMQAERGELSQEETLRLYLRELDYVELMAFYEERGELEKNTFLRLTQDEDEDPDYVLEAYEAIHAGLTAEEQAVFADLCANAYIRKISDLFATITRRQNHG